MPNEIDYGPNGQPIEPKNGAAKENSLLIEDVPAGKFIMLRAVDVGDERWIPGGPNSEKR